MKKKNGRSKMKPTMPNKERGSWFGVNPVPRIIPNKKVTSRKPKNDKEDFYSDYEDEYDY